MIVVFGLLLVGIFETKSAEQCKPVEVNGYLHEQCGTDRYGRITYKCPRSNNEYQIDFSKYGSCGMTGFTDICPSDPGFYQACGHTGCSGFQELGGTPLLCGSFLCMHSEKGKHLSGKVMETHASCHHGWCSNTELNMVGPTR